MTILQRAAVGVATTVALLWVIAAAQAGARTPEAEPSSADLVVPITLGPGDDRTTLLFASPGEPPDSAHLISPDGRHLAELTAGSCPTGTPLHTATPSPDRWCLIVDGLRPGHTFTGTLTGEESTILLTTPVTADFRSYPLVVSVLTAALSVMLLGGAARNAKAVARRRTATVVGHNQQPAGPVENFASWHEHALARIDDPTDLLAAANAIARQGPIIIAQDRKRLEDADTAPIPLGHPVLVAAEAELARHPAFDATEIRDHSGNPSTSRAASILASISTIANGYTLLGRLKRRAGSGAPPAAKHAIDALGGVLGSSTHPVDADAVDQVMTTARIECGVLPALAGAGSTTDTATAPPPGPEVRPPSRRVRLPAWATSAALAMAYTTLAVLAAKVAVYDARATFGTTEDYIALSLAVFAASATAQLGTLALIWTE